MKCLAKLIPRTGKLRSWVLVAWAGLSLGAARNAPCKINPQPPGDQEIRTVADAPRPSASAPGKRPITIEDSIRMRRIVGSSYARFAYAGALSRDFAFFSPSRRRFVIILRRGNLEHNTNDYSMLLFGIRKSFGFTRARVLVAFSSSSNREAIKDPVWLRDNDTILFLGERLGEKTQLYSVRCSTGAIRKITRHATSLVAYSASAKGAIVFAAEQPAKGLMNSRVVRRGLHVSSEAPEDIIGGRSASYERQLYAFEGRVSRPLKVTDSVYGDPIDLWISPDGRHAVIKANVTRPPVMWTQYENESLRKLVLGRPPRGFPSWVLRYDLIDLKTGRSRPLLDSPIGSWASEIAWSPDSRSVAVSGVYLPLNVKDSDEKAARKKNTFVVEVHLPDLEVIKIADRDLRILGWDSWSGMLELKYGGSHMSDGQESIEYYRRTKNGWKLDQTGAETRTSRDPNLTIQQSLNMAPRIVATDPATGQRALILNPNPQFDGLCFGRVEQLEWAAAGGRQVTGALYLPPDYRRDRKYPLVIQTHGFDPQAFWIDGPFTTAFAAQTLAGKQIIVLQVPDSHTSMNTAEEAPAMAETYEKAVDFLDAQGVIDRSRVGIVGFSRTGLYVRYLLTHSQMPFAAATIADGFDDGYFSYLAFANSNPFFASEVENLVGGPPFGDTLALWERRSSGFRLDHVKTPVQLQANGPASLLSTWDWFSGLKRLHRPVDLLYLPAGSHILEKPWERQASQQGMVDWMCFWLKGEEDPDPSKAEQYRHWRGLREMER